MSRRRGSSLGRSGSRPDRQEGWTYPVCLVSATHHTGIGKLTEHLEQHRNFLTQSGLLEKLRLKHQNGWVMRLLRDEFGSFGLQLAGGQAHLAERLKKNRINLFGEYQNAREQILARFTPATSFEKFIKKEATT